MMVDAPEQEDRQGDDDEGDPGALGEFACAHNEYHHASGQGPNAVDQSLAGPASGAHTPPVAHHARLRKGERQERANGEQGDQCVAVSLEEDDKQPCGPGQQQISVGEHQPVTQRLELPGKIAMLGQNGRQAWESQRRQS